jgi:outer membrane receptor for ferrienterochelin and colicin
MRLRVILSFLFAALVIVDSGNFTVIAGTTGKIAGKIVDKADNQPLPGANIRVEGTTLGAASGLDGQFVILSIPPGTYSVKASFIGYGDMVVSNVKISIDATTRVNFELSAAVLELGEVVEVVATRELIQRDLTATTAIVSSENIESLPVTEVNEVIRLQAGVVEKDGLHFRGGRAGEVAYWIDGVPVTDAFDGSTIVDVNKDVVQELQVISGAFNAEYGQALSGIVNIVTKEGSNRFGGSVTSYVGDYLSRNDDFNWGLYPDGTPAPSVPLFRDIKDFDPVAIRNFDGTLFGAIVKDKLFFNVNARYIYFDGWLRGQRRFQPHNIGYTDSTGAFIPSRDADGLGNNKFEPMNWNRKIFGQAKLTYRLSPNIKLSNTTILDNVEFQEYDRSFILNSDGNLNKFRNGITSILKLTHLLSSRTFYDVAVSFTEKHFQQYVYEDIHDSRYVHPRLLDQQLFSFKTGGVNMQHFDRRTSTYLGKLDITSQVTNTHEVKTGAEFRRHRIFFEDIFLRPVLSQSDIDLATDSPFIETLVPDLSETGHDRHKHNPVEFSVYLQDKIELRNFIVNIGIRMDYFNPDGQVLADPTDPNIYNPIRPENRFTDLNENGIQDPDEPGLTNDDRRTYWYKDADSKLKFSPRLGVSFPVTATGVFHFSFGHFFQIPRFELLYRNSDFKIGTGTGNQGLIGNADLEPEQTINGEIGLKQQLSDASSVEVTAFFRDIRNLTSTRADAITVFGGAAEYNKFVNADFGFVRGVILAFHQRFAAGFSASADYTYQIARASNSDPEEARKATTAGSLPEIQLTPVPWDQAHTLNISAAYSGKSWGGGLIVQAAAGQPYTPRRDEDISTLATNSERKPSIIDVDLRLYKDIKLANNFQAKLFLRVFNLFDTLNEINVFDDTGRADFTTDRNRTIRTVGTSTPVNLIDDWFTNPTNFSEPRRIELGMTVSF